VHASSSALAAPEAGYSTWTSDGVCLLVEVVAERLGAGRVAQFGHRLGFDLPDAFSGDPVELADLVKRAGWAAGEPESQLDNVGLPLGERGQHRL
jgi:hypothetical protein